MKLSRYSSEHRPALNKLLEARGVSAGNLPELGFVIEADSAPAAFGFLRKVEGAGYLFDSLISNPELNSEQRNNAMAMLWDAIIEASGTEGLLGYTTDNGTLQRALARGFVQAPHTVLVYKGQ